MKFFKQDKYPNHIRRKSNYTKQLQRKQLCLLWHLTQFTEMGIDFHVCFQLFTELFIKTVKRHEGKNSRSETNRSFYGGRGQCESLQETSASP